MRAARAILLFSCLAAAGLAAQACGKKGPPLAPLNRVPARVMDLTARRTGDVVAVTFTIPSANMDDSKPADIARVDVYAYTAMAANDVRDPRRMTLVGSVPVRKPPEPEAEKPKPGDRKAGAQKPATPPAPPEPGEAQGALVTVTETLTAAMLVPIAPDARKPAPAPVPAEPASLFGTPLVPPLAGPVPQPEPRRFYVAFGVSRGGNRGGASPRPAVPLGAPPLPPPQPSLVTTEAGVVVSWAVPPGSRLPYQEPAEGTILASTPRGMESAPSISYVVYRTSRGQTADGKAPAAGAGAAGPVRLTKKPVTTLSFTDPDVEFGVERCYDVRTVTTQGSATVESAPSPAACITPADTFPPPAPASLAAVAGEGAISLIWSAVDAPDMAGYIVLRGEALAGELAPLFDAPIRESTYRDGTAKPGVRYVYAVVALDRATPANRSALSNRVEATAR